MSTATSEERGAPGAPAGETVTAALTDGSEGALQGGPAGPAGPR
ncbi:MAG: hypothetical protein JWR41_2468, partial [Modestobacter sp.]|nr:hypothetical protein [Modestobacter sp.]